MAKKQYPVIGRENKIDRWAKAPEYAPTCIAPGCRDKALFKPHVEVNIFRGDDELAGGVCKDHSKDPVKLLEWTALRKAENKKRLAEIEARKNK